MVLCGDEKPDSLYTLINQAESAAEADNVFSRLSQACHRFLGIELHLAGRLPPDLAIGAAGRASEPFVTAMPNCDAREDLDRLVATLMEMLGIGRQNGALRSLEEHATNRPSPERRMTA